MNDLRNLLVKERREKTAGKIEMGVSFLPPSLFSFLDKRNLRVFKC